MLHFYEGQIRKFLTQFIRVLSNFSVETGKGKDDQITLRAVPVVYGDPTRQVANIIRQNSENALQYTPKIAAYVRELNYDRERMQNPYHIEKQHLKERGVDSDGNYTNQLGAGYSRHMEFKHRSKITDLRTDFIPFQSGFRDTKVRQLH
jgi:hypothetical protein